MTQNKSEDEVDTEVDPNREARFAPDGSWVEAEEESGIEAPAPAPLPAPTSPPPTPSPTRRGPLFDMWVSEQRQRPAPARSSRFIEGLVRVEFVRLEPIQAGSARRLEDGSVRLKGDPAQPSTLSIGVEGQVYRGNIGPCDAWSEALRTWLEQVGIGFRLVVIDEDGSKIVFGLTDSD